MIKKNYILPSVVIIFALLFFFGDRIKTVFSPVLASLILTYIAYPFVKRLSERMPKIVAAILFYLLIISFISLLIAFIIPSLIEGIDNLIAYLPRLSETISEKIPFADFSLSSLSDFLSGKSAYFTGILKDTISFLISSLFAITLSCFFLMDTSFFKNGFSSLLPEALTVKLLPSLREIDAVFKNFFRGQILLSVLLSGITFIFLLFLKVENALVLSLIYGVFCLIPNVGPFLGGIPIVAVSYLTSPLTALLSFFAVLLTQVIENVFLSPKIKADSVDISPAAAFLSIYIGAGFFGLSGVIFAVPVVASVKIILRRIISAIT